LEDNSLNPNQQEEFIAGMDYLTSLIQRSKRPMTIVASVFGGGYLAVSYLRSKLDEMQDSLTRTRACTEK
jgi:hypothetical protein